MSRPPGDTSANPRPARDSLEPAGIARRFILAELITAALEGALVAGPAYGIFQRVSPDPQLFARVGLPIVIALVVVWLPFLAVWLAPARRGVQSVQRGVRPTGPVRDAAYRAMLLLPLRALIYRTFAWALCGALAGSLMVRYGDWLPRHAIALASVTSVAGLACNVVRAGWYIYILRRARGLLFRRLAPIRLFTDGYRRRLHLVELAIVGGGLAASLAFIFYSHAVTRAQFLELLVVLPLFGFAAAGAWLIALRPITRETAAYLRARDSGGEGPAVTTVYRRAQSIPYRLAGFNLAAWLILSASLNWFARAILRFALDDAVLLTVTVFVIGLGATLYSLLAFREIIRPLLEHLTVEHRLPVRGIRSGFSLRSKLLTSFGGLALLACGLSLVWGFIQYKSLVAASVSKQAGLGLAWLRSEVQAAATESEEPPDTKLVRDVLHTVDRRRPELSAVIYFIPQGMREGVVSLGGGPMGAPTLPWYAHARATLARDGSLQVSPLDLWGRHGRLRVRWHGGELDLGSLAVMIPNYRARGPSILRPLQELVVFFLLLFTVCAGIVVLTVSQVVGPIRRIEERADEMARGELAVSVPSAGEGDEVGRLTFALEQMRRALREKLRSTEEVNLDLERAVQRRTADLAKKNRELAETLQKLTLAQDQLVRAEKMASIGQLVAGIAHEINNPVNAIVNTVGPLEQAISEVSSEDEQTRMEARADLREMIRVVQSGAKRTKDIVQALHNYSRTDDENVVSVDINRSIDDSLELLRHITRQSIEIERRFSDVGRVEGHAGQLGQVFMNLLTNAAQALAGTPSATITITTTAVDGGIEVEIADNGPGIPEEVRPRIFDPFFTTKDVGEGSGLGLSIVHGIVERHGGTISVESRLHEGTAFKVFLPRSGSQLGESAAI